MKTAVVTPLEGQQLLAASRLVQLRQVETRLAMLQTQHALLEAERDWQRMIDQVAQQYGLDASRPITVEADGVTLTQGDANG